MATETDSTIPFLVDTVTGRVVGYVDKAGGERSMSGAKFPAGGDPDAAIPVGASFTLDADHNGAVFACTAALTVTIPAGLTPRPAVAIIPPPSGNLSIAVSGGAQINGATTTLTRSRASNLAGVAVQPYVDADGYGVSGS